MILVYNDSQERAMLMATIVGGVSLGINGVARLRNIYEVHELLQTKLKKDGFLSTFFRGEPYVFIYTNGNAFALNKMVDYDPSYADIKKRPVPFVPEPFDYRLTDSELTPKFENYKKMYAEANYIINAATDSIIGELSFFSFQRAMGKPKRILRVRPQIMDESTVLEAFNAPEESEPRKAYELACQLRERMEWVVSCNVSNALSIHNRERKVLACGRLEALLLSYIISRENAAMCKAYGVAAQIQVEDITISAKFDAHKFASKGEADSFAKTLANRVSVEDVVIATCPDNQRLHNIFTLQIEAGKKLGLSVARVNEAANFLFEHGYITWPTASQSIPWRIKAMYTNAITALAKQELYVGTAMPRDVDNFTAWDTEDDKTKHAGILVTEQVPVGVPPVEKSVYDIIAESNLRVINSHRTESVFRLTAESGGAKLRAVKTSATGPVPSATAVHAGETLMVKKYIAVPFDEAPTTPYTEALLLDDVFQIWTHGFSDDSAIFGSAIDNLVQWGHVARKADGTLATTDRGRLTEKYIRGSSLTDSSENMLWDRRLKLVAVGDANPSTVLNDIKEYAGDVAAEIVEKAELIKEMGGIDLSECVCPLCRGQMVLTDKGWECSSDACTFALPKEHRSHIITAFDMGKLLTEGVTDLILDFKSGSKPPFAGRLILNPRNQIELTFKSPYPCRKCGKPLNEFSWGLKCLDDGFTLSTTKDSVRLDPETIFALIEGKKSRLINSFVNVDNHRFGAYLYLDEQDKIKMEFPSPSKNKAKT